MPGIGPLPGAEFLAATGGDQDAFASADRLAGFAGVASAARDPGKVSGNLHRVVGTSALISIRCCDESRRFY
jgi:transposase